MLDLDKFFSLLFDEMVISSDLMYCPDLDIMEGNVGSLGSCNKLSNHVLVCMVQSLRKNGNI